MSEPFIGEIRLMAFDFAPRNWAQCNGQLMDIQQNFTVYALLGTSYGGDGQTTFALPDLRGRAVLHADWGYYRGMVGGVERAPMVDAQIGAHTHAFRCTGNNADNNMPENRYYANSTLPAYTTNMTNLKAMNAGAVGSTGSSVPHENMQPSLVMNYCIALDGEFPTRS